MAFNARGWLPTVGGWFLAATRTAFGRGRLVRQRLLTGRQGARSGDGPWSRAACRAEPGDRIRSAGRPEPTTGQLDCGQPGQRAAGDDRRRADGPGFGFAG